MQTRATKILFGLGLCCLFITALHAQSPYQRTWTKHKSSPQARAYERPAANNKQQRPQHAEQTRQQQRPSRIQR